MRIVLNSIMVVAFLVAAFAASAEDNKEGLTASIVMQGGRAYPSGELEKSLQPSPTYRLKLFGGKKVNLKFIGAVGLGLDFTYAQYDFKGEVSSKDFYRRFTWDWFYIPIGIGFFHIMPGLSWVVTETKIVELGINETSIRPSGMLDVGASALFAENFGLTVNGRYERTAIDREYYGPNNEESLNITGNYMSWFAGIMLQW